MMIWSLCLLRLLFVLTVSLAFLTYVILVVWGTLHRHFVECLSIEIYWTFFLTVTVELWALGRKTIEVKAPFSTHPSKGTYYQPDLSLLVLTFIIWLRQGWSDSSTMEMGVYLQASPLLLYHPSWKVVTMHILHMMGGESCLTSERVE